MLAQLSSPQGQRWVAGSSLELSGETPFGSPKCRGDAGNPGPGRGTRGASVGEEPGAEDRVSVPPAFQVLEKEEEP